MTDLPLTGLRGIVLTQAWAGTFATQLLGLLGAEIIQIEARQRLDSWRGGYGGAMPSAIRDNGTAVHPWNCAPNYNAVNLNKQTITLDLSRPEGIDIFKRLVPFADIVAENFSPRVMGNLGIDYEQLRAIRPDVILLSMSAYGASGPYTNVPGIGGTIEPMAGMSALLGYENGPPINSGLMYPDPVAGYFGAAAVLIALHHRRRTGEGQCIDLSMQETSMTFIADALMDYSANGRVRGRMGNRHTSIAPHGVYACGDPLPRPLPHPGTPGQACAGEGSTYQPTLLGTPLSRLGGRGAGGGGRWIAIGASDDGEFARLCAVAGHPEWLVDPRFADVAARKRNEDALDAAVGAWTAALDAAELEAALRQAGVTAAVVRNADDVIATEHLWERGGLVRVAHPEAGEHAQMAAPWRLNRASGGVTRPAPLLGEHSRAVLARFLGIGDEEYTRLEALGITGSGPPD